MRRFWRALAIAAVAGSLAGCGIFGDGAKPDQTGQNAMPAAAPAPAAAVPPAPAAPPANPAVTLDQGQLGAEGASAMMGTPIAVVYFSNGSSRLSARAMEVLRQAAQIQRQWGGRLSVVGHASSRTAVVSYAQHMAINQRLSQARANAVARALVRLGTASDAIGVSAVGSERPIFDESMPTGEAGNRRVEIYLVGASVPAPAPASALAQPALTQPALAEPETSANGAVTVDLSVLNQLGPAPGAGGAYVSGQPLYGQPLYGQPGYAAPGAAAPLYGGYNPYAVQPSGGLLYPPVDNPVSILTVPPPLGAAP
jgi:outer membrane protein OmpA-like peptidoglycan-associated protein